ncbi:MAG: hypothetical protein J6K21_00260 [Bacilli bacterium]|nr:hypothetical protein [Bacilli bacterium]
MKKKLIYMLILFISLFVFNNIEAVKAVNENDIAEKTTQNNGITCSYYFSDDSLRGYSNSFYVNCYFYKSNLSYSKYCFYNGNKISLENWGSIKGTDFKLNNYIKSQNICPKYAISNYKKIILADSETTKSNIIENNENYQKFNHTGTISTTSKTEEEKKMCYEDLNTNVSNIENIINKYDFETCSKNSNGVTNLTSCESQLGSLKTFIDGFNKKYDEYSKINCIDINSQNIKQLKTSVDSAQKFYDTKNTELLAKKCEENHSLGVKCTDEQEEALVEVTRKYNSGCNIFGNEGSKTRKYIKWAINIIRYAIPLIIVIFGITDYLGALFSGEEKNMKEAQRRVIMRVVIGIIALLLPALIKLLVNISGLIFNTGIDSGDIFCDFI